MIAPEPTLPDRSPSPEGTSPGRAGTAPGPPAHPDDGPVGTLRGAGVTVDTKVAVRVAALVALAAIAVVAAVLFLVGYQKNSQITSLQTHGVGVEAKVSGCTGLLGGSGSNGAGYDCAATYLYGGRRYTEDVPGNEELLQTGSTIRGVVASDDPALFSTPSTVAGEHSSARVYVAPAILAVAFVLLSGLFFVRWRRTRRADRGAT